MRLVYARDNDLTYNSIRFDMSLQNFKKPLDMFWPQLNTEKKTFRRIFSYDFSWKKKALGETRGAGLKHKSARFFL